MKNLINLFIIMGFLGSCSCPEKWELTIGGKGQDGAYSVGLTKDGGCIVAGFAHDGDPQFKNVDFESYLIKVDKYKNTSYAKNIAFPYDPDPSKQSGGQYSKAVLQTMDGGYIVAGINLGSATGSYNFELIKFKPGSSSETLGVIDWDSVYGGALDEGTSGNVTVTQTKFTNGDPKGYTLAGTSGSFCTSGNSCSDAHPGTSWPYSNYFLMNTSLRGIPLWAYVYSGQDTMVDYVLTSCCHTKDEGYILGGYISDSGVIKKAYIIKTDAMGRCNPPFGWSKTYEVDLPFIGTRVESVQQTFDGGYIMTGWAWRNPKDVNNNSNVILFKLSADGTNQWSNIYNIQTDAQGKPVEVAGNEAHCVQQISIGNRGFIVSGVSGGNGEKDGAFLMLTDINGRVNWANTYGKHDDVFYSVVEGRNCKGEISGYIAAGKTASSGERNPDDVYVIKTDAGGFTGCEKRDTAFFSTVKITVDNVITLRTNNLVQQGNFVHGKNTPSMTDWGKPDYECH